jgi:hypothetical protein
MRAAMAFLVLFAVEQVLWEPYGDLILRQA